MLLTSLLLSISAVDQQIQVLVNDGFSRRDARIFLQKERLIETRNQRNTLELDSTVKAFVGVVLLMEKGVKQARKQNNPTKNPLRLLVEGLAAGDNDKNEGMTSDEKAIFAATRILVDGLVEVKKDGKKLGKLDTFFESASKGLGKQAERMLRLKQEYSSDDDNAM